MRDSISPRVVVDLTPRLKCPAAEPIGEIPTGSAARCRIEQSTVSSVGHGSSLWGYCCGDYSACPTWQTEKVAIEEHREKALGREMLIGAD